MLDTRYQGLCWIIGGLDLMQSGRPIYLPFEAASCALVNVSAWRDGPFDADPPQHRIQQRPAASTRNHPRESRFSSLAITPGEVISPQQSGPYRPSP